MAGKGHRRKVRIGALLFLVLAIVGSACGDADTDQAAVSASGDAPGSSLPPPLTTGSSLPSADEVRDIEESLSEGARLVPALRASSPIARGTSVEEAANTGAFEVASIPMEFRPETAVESVAQLRGVALFDISPGTLIVEGMFEPGG